MVANGLIPFIAFGGTVLFEMRIKGLVCSKTKTPSPAAVVPVDSDPADSTGAAEVSYEAKEGSQAGSKVSGPASRTQTKKAEAEA